MDPAEQTTLKADEEMDLAALEADVAALENEESEEEQEVERKDDATSAEEEAPQAPSAAQEQPEEQHGAEQAGPADEEALPHEDVEGGEKEALAVEGATQAAASTLQALAAAPAPAPAAKPSIAKRKALVAPKVAAPAAAPAAQPADKPVPTGPAKKKRLAAKAAVPASAPPTTAPATGDADNGAAAAPAPAAPKSKPSPASLKKPKAPTAAAAATAPAEGGDAKAPAKAPAKPKLAKPAAGKAAGATGGGGSAAAPVGGKRPRMKSAYLFFTDERRPDVKKDEPGLSMAELSARLADLWKKMSDEEKAPYVAKADAEKEETRAKQAAWDLANPKPPKAARAGKKGGGGDHDGGVEAAGGVAGHASDDEDDDEGLRLQPAPKKQKRQQQQQGGSGGGGEGKRKRPARAKSNKHDMIAFASFCASRLPEMLVELGPEAGRPEAMAIVQKEWDGMEEAERAAYVLPQADAPAAEDGGDGDGGAAQSKPRAASSGDGGSKHKGSRARKHGRGKAPTAEEQAEEEQAGDEEEVEDDEVTEEPLSIIGHDLRGKYWVITRGTANFYDFLFVDMSKVKQLRATLAEDGGAGTADAADDGFNGFGARLLELSDEYERYRKQFSADGHECLDAQGGLNFDLMRPGSSLDMCALLGVMREKAAGGLLAAKPPRKQSAVKGVEDSMIHVPALTLSMVTQRVVHVWKERALRAEKELESLRAGGAPEA